MSQARPSMYHQIIRLATNCKETELDEIEDIMRHDVFHSTLDWQSKAQLIAGTKLAYQVYLELQRVT